MPIEITMPRLSDTMEEGTLVQWRVKVGDTVKADEHIADVETDKATMELNVFDEGTIAKLAVEAGATVAVGGLLCVLAEPGEDVEEAAKSAGASSGGAKKSSRQQAGGDDASSGGGTATAVAEDDEASASGGANGQTDGHDGGRIRVSPLARRLAEEAGVDLASITGSGPGGRIIKSDILQAKRGGGSGGSAPASHTRSNKSAEPASPSATTAPASAPRQPAKPTPGLERKSVPLTNMRKTIAKRLVESKTQVPHFQVSVAIDMDAAIHLRETINAQLSTQGVKLSVNDFVTKAVALACVEHPGMNASWSADAIQYHGTVNVGTAIALPAEKGGGLVVATLRDVQTLGLRAISDEVKRLAKKAREQGLSVQEMSDSTITLSNLGMPQYGVVQFNPIINPPNAAILGIGAALQRPVVRNVDGKPQIVVGHEMIVTLSGDHRVIDGALAAEYLASLRRLLENPAALLV